MPDTFEQEFKDYIRIIGRGLRAGRALTEQEAFQAMSLLIEGKITAEQKGAFLMLLRVREESPEELAGFTLAFRNANMAGLSELNVDLDMGCYAGKRRHLPWFLLAVMALARSGKRIFLHGTQEPDSHRLYLSEVLPQLGLAIALNVDEARGQLAKFGFSYMDLAKVNPKLNDVIQLRSQFGLRSCANTLARMLNPSQAAYSLQGVFHKDVDNKHKLTAALLNQQDKVRGQSGSDVLCFRGEGGELEYNPEREVSLHLCRDLELSTMDVPALEQNWSIKDKELDAATLVRCWQGQWSSDYALSAITGTLAIMLVLTENLDWQVAYAKSQQLWAERDKIWPAPLPESSAKSFSVKGRQSAH
jgi:anthranilate phosphoribosyltransferase